MTEFEFQRRGQMIRHKTDTNRFWGEAGERRGEPVFGWVSAAEATLYLDEDNGKPRFKHPEDAASRDSNDYEELRRHGELRQAVETGTRRVP